MTDKTIEDVDKEPWNAQSDALPAKRSTVVQFPISIHRCVVRGLPILTQYGDHAKWVYDIIGLPGHEAEWCNNCEGLEMCFLWQEWEHDASLKGRRKHAIRRNLWLCQACSDALRALPLGQRWKRSSRARDVRFAIETLKRVKAELAAINPMSAACKAVNIVDEEIKRLGSAQK